MSVYRMEDGTVLNTRKATATWDEKLESNGSNMISRATGSQWDHEMLRRSRRGRYYVERTSQWQGRMDHAEWISERAAVAWLLNNGHELPDELVHLRDEVEE